MRALIATEFLKLRTTRGPLVLLLVAIGLAILGVSGLASRGLDPSDPGLVQGLLAHAGLTSLVTLILGIGAFGTEYRHRTITDTYLATPRRSQVVVAKLVAYGIAGLAIGVASAATALATAGAWTMADGASLDLTGTTTWVTLAGAIAWNGLFAVIGVALGALLPNYATAIAAALAWIALVEGLVGQLLGGLARWLPMAAGRALGNAPASDLLPQVTAGVALASFAIVLALAAGAVVARRDVA
jgi:ABC-2 type transport system permease protein